MKYVFYAILFLGHVWNVQPEWNFRFYSFLLSGILGKCMSDLVTTYSHLPLEYGG